MVTSVTENTLATIAFPTPGRGIYSQGSHCFWINVSVAAPFL